MNELDKRVLDQFREMEKRMGRLLRSMALPRMSAMHSGTWSPAVDVYETDDEVFVYVDTAGIDPEKLSVTAARTGVTIAGCRRLPVHDKIRSIHQLEIEHGHFRRSVTFSVPVQVTATVSNCKNGLLEIRMPKEKPTGRVTIKVV